MVCFTKDEHNQMVANCKAIFNFITNEVIPNLRENVSVHIPSGNGIKDLVIYIHPTSKEPITLIKGKSYSIYDVGDNVEYFYSSICDSEMMQVISNWNHGINIKSILMKKVEETKTNLDINRNFVV
jgi:hypothetical protein